MQSSMRGGNAPYQINWDQVLHNQNGLQREDIYRQRVYGNNSGTAQFIEVEQRRKIKPQWLIVYLIFVVATYTYTFDRLDVWAEYEVYEAIRTPFDKTAFRSDPQPEYWADIDSMDDVQEWLLNAFPDIVTPDIQHFNKPLGQIRFTMRKIKMQNNTDTRLNDFQPQIWNDAEGIRPEDTTSDNDDKEGFGAHRVWANVSLDWSFPTLVAKGCPEGSLLIDQVDFSEPNVSITITNCKQWCEQLIVPYTCHCFTKSSHADDGVCDFYQVPADKFTPASAQTTVLLAFPDSDNSIVIPAMRQSPGTNAYFPKMKKFIFNEEQKGYRKTPGFIQYLSYYSQADLKLMADNDQKTPSTPQRIMSSEIEDWIAGGYLGRQTVTISVDFATYNVNYDMFSWVQLTFQSTAAGSVMTDLNIASIRIVKSKDLAEKWSFSKEFSTFWSVVYIILVIFYCACEVWEMSCCSKGHKYFFSMWNWLTMFHLLLNLSTIILYWIFKGQTDFVDELIAMQQQAAPTFQTDNLISFSSQVSSYQNFKVAASLNMLVMAFQLLQYLNDIQPRVAVLVDTVSHSFMPIFFFTLVCCVFIYGTIMWTFVWFGRYISDFRSFSQTVVTVVQLTVGEFRSFDTMRKEFGLESFLFYIPYQLFMIILVLNFPRAVLCAAYADSVTSHKENQQKEKSRQAAKDSTIGSNDIYRFFKNLKSNAKKLVPEELNAKEFVKMMKNRNRTKVKHKQAALGLYLVFTALYTIMCIMIMKTTNANEISDMIDAVTTLPTYRKVNPITGQSIRGANFHTINSRGDVSGFVKDVFPQQLYETSKLGTFDGQTNPLLTYSTATQFKQLVINDWSIIVGGQHPVRVTLKYNKMKEIGSVDAIKGVLKATELVRESKTADGEQATVTETYGLPDESLYVGASELSHILGTETVAALEALHCNYSYGYGAEKYEDLNGWVCMLSVEEAHTLMMLKEIADKLVTRQTMTLTLDYVIYNGWAETFAYVVVMFGFQPSGLIWKNIDVEPVNLQLHSGTHGVFLIILEILVMTLNLYYLLMLFVNMLKAMCPRKDKRKVVVGDEVTEKNPDENVVGHPAKVVSIGAGDTVTLKYEKTDKAPILKQVKLTDIKKDNQVQERKSIGSCAHSFFEMFREFIFFFVLDWFNIFDFMSSVCTIVTLALFWKFCLSPLSSYYFFQEEPIWIKGKCTSNNFEWCNDQQVITQFYLAKGTFKNFVRICSINTVFIFMRLLRYVKAFRSMRVIFATMVRGFEDIMWFVVVMFTGLLGYQFCGHIVFGGTADGFKSKWSSLRSCFEIFLGKFDGNAMASVSLPMMICYVLTFWFFFKLIVINMFLAIIDKNYKEEDAERQENASRYKDDMKKKQPSALSQVLRSLKNLLRPPEPTDQQAGSGEAKQEDQAVDKLAIPDQAADTGGTEAPNGYSGDLGGTDAIGADPMNGESRQLLDDVKKQESDETGAHGDGNLKTLLSEKDVTAPTWKELPAEIKDWSLKKAAEVNGILNDLIKTRTQQQQAEEDPEPAQLDGVLEDAETKIQGNMEDWKKEAEAVKHLLDTTELAELKSVHKDQESLSWYIMKREAELKKLEARVEMMQERKQKMDRAANSLINSKDDVLFAKGLQQA